MAVSVGVSGRRYENEELIPGRDTTIVDVHLIGGTVSKNLAGNVIMWSTNRRMSTLS